MQMFSVKRKTNKIDDVFFNNFKWNNIPTTYKLQPAKRT